MSVDAISSRKPTGVELNAVAAAMWNSGETGDRPAWRDLDPKVDGALIHEFIEQAEAGIKVFLALRTARRTPGTGQAVT